MRPEVVAFVTDGPLPDEDADEDEIDRRDRQLRAIARPVTTEQAEALAACFGPDDCYGLAWSLAHLVETAGTPVPTGRPAADAFAHRRIRQWALATGLVTDVGTDRWGGPERNGPFVP